MRVRTAHQRSWQRCAFLWSVGALAACQEPALRPSLWPAPDFELRVEEFEFGDGHDRKVRELRVLADGLVVYAVATRARTVPLPPADDGKPRLAALPVFERLAVYQLVPTSVRAFARRLEALGIDRLEVQQGERGGTFDRAVQMTWIANGERRSVRAAGRVAGPMAELMALVHSHLPQGERFGLVVESDRAVQSPLRGVPSPVTDARGAQQAFVQLAGLRHDDPWLLLAAFVLACDGGDRAAAEDLLTRWREATGSERAAALFADQAPLPPELLQRMLPDG